MPSEAFEELVQEASSARRAGWDFTFLHGRTRGGDLPWSYTDLARPLVASSARLLDQDTGGGEILAGLAPLPPHAVATEPWEPNVRIARERLEPLGVEVRYRRTARIPASDAEFDLVLNRHGEINPAELSRVLDDGGKFLTQQVGEHNNAEFNDYFGAPPGRPGAGEEPATCAELAESLQRHGLRITRAEHVTMPFTYLDIGAVVFQLLTVSWTVPGFSVERYEVKLRELDRRIRQGGGFTVNDQRHLVEAIKA